ncbi:MAG TPA: hypothetical protein DCP31_36870 [Cyanobacteria bacterium UBA8543]|nr:hypothetical protein [Cyanobacteria bacterium UBA8543]
MRSSKNCCGNLATSRLGWELYKPLMNAWRKRLRAALTSYGSGSSSNQRCMWMNPLGPCWVSRNGCGSQLVNSSAYFTLVIPGKRAELVKQLGESFDGVMSTDDYSVYNGYPVKAQQKCLAHLRRHFKKVVKLNHGNNPVLAGTVGDRVFQDCFDARVGSGEI